MYHKQPGAQLAEVAPHHAAAHAQQAGEMQVVGGWAPLNR